MSATLERTQNIVYRKKSLGNGDIEKDIKKQIKKGKSKALETQLTKMNQTMKQFDKTQKKFKPTSTQKMKYEANLLKQNVKKINKNQKELNKKLAQTQLNSKNPNYYFSKNKHLPNTLNEIDENTELAKLLLKNPDKMSTEEKIYIASFNNREFELFINYLRMKDRELKWVGNGLGSGHYLEGLISIYRKYGNDENERYASLRRYLKLNYNNNKAKEQKTTTNFNFQIEDIKGDNATFNNYNNDYETFEAQSREMMKQLDALTNKINANKENIEMQKFKNTNELIHNELDRKKNKFKEDLDNLQNMKNNPDNEVDELYQQFIAKYKIGRNKDSEDILLGKKLIDYLNNNGLNELEFAKRFGENQNLQNFDKDIIIVDNIQQILIDLKVFDEEESESLCKILKTYSGNEITVDFFAKFITNLCNETREKMEKEMREKEELEKSKKKSLFLEEENLQGDNLEYDNLSNENSSDYSYDGQIIQKDNNREYNERLRKQLKGQYFEEFEKVMKDKFATLINKTVKGYLTRKNVKVERIYLYILAKRVVNLFRKNYERRMKEKDMAAKKITHLLQKNYWNKKDKNAVTHFTSRWLKNKKFISNQIKQNVCATLIQVKWREYIKQLTEKENVLDEQMLRTKICFICKKNKVEYLCKDCEDNHYCKTCFRKYHMRGNKRNHNYLWVSDLLNKKQDKYQMNINAKRIDECEQIKEYLRENNINLYERLSMWDFKKNNTITYLNLKDALAMKGFEIEKKYQNMILDYSLKYVINGTVGDKNKYIISLKFCDDLL